MDKGMRNTVKMAKSKDEENISLLAPKKIILG